MGVIRGYGDTRILDYSSYGQGDARDVQRLSQDAFRDGGPGQWLLGVEG